jgi:hypothetical protein
LPTKCVFPPELTDLQLLAYLDRPDANQATGSHLLQCPHCQEKAGALELFQKRLRTRLYRSTCPSPEELGEYTLHMSSASRRLVIAQHLRECPLCTLELATLEEFTSEFAHQPGPIEQVKVLVAHLVNSSVMPALRGQTNKALKFEADGIVVVLDIQPVNKDLTEILGQVADDNQDQWTGALVELREGVNLQFSTQVDDLGAFHLEGISPGIKELRITSENKMMVVVSSFEVSS